MQGLIRTTTLSLTLVATTTWADTHFVAPGQSIQAAVDAAADGDVIELGAGEHLGSVELMARDLRFQGQGSESTVWRGDNSGMVDATYSDLEFEGITFADGRGTQDGLFLRGGAMSKKAVAATRRLLRRTLLPPRNQRTHRCTSFA